MLSFAGNVELKHIGFNAVDGQLPSTAAADPFLSPDGHWLRNANSNRIALLDPQVTSNQGNAVNMATDQVSAQRAIEEVAEHAPRLTG